MRREGTPRQAILELVTALQGLDLDVSAEEHTFQMAVYRDTSSGQVLDFVRERTIPAVRWQGRMWTLQGHRRPEDALLDLFGNEGSLNSNQRAEWLFAGEGDDGIRALLTWGDGRLQAAMKQHRLEQVLDHPSEALGIRKPRFNGYGLGLPGDRAGSSNTTPASFSKPRASSPETGPSM